MIKEDKMVLSLDCSTTCVGFAIFDEDNLIEYGKLVPTIESLEWRDRIRDFIPQLNSLINKYKPTKIYAEDIPLTARAALILLQLSVLQGAIMGLVYKKGIEIEYIPVGTWRKNIGISTGNKDRDSKKIASIIKANELFGINLKCLYTRNGTYKSKGSDDDIADSILVYASTRDKYKIKSKSFGRK